MNVAVIVIGDELLMGNVTDTNSGYIARTLAPYGWEVTLVTTVGDDPAMIYNAIERSFAAAPVVLTTGGLGPTKDDITKGVLCRYFGGTLHRDPEVTANVERLFARKHLAMNELTASQADVPTSCRVIQNLVGTAPIMWFDQPGADKVLVAMPGVPSETREMFASAVLPQLLHRYDRHATVRHHWFMTYGMSESGLAEHLAEWEASQPAGVHLAYLPVDGIIYLRIDCHTDTEALAEALIAEATDTLRILVAPWLLAERQATPAELLIEAARAHGDSIATAESCTGGNIAHLITLVAGCSDVMMGGVVSYSNDVKTGLLGVDPQAIAAHGAVSQEVALQMSQGVCRATNSTIGIATSGIAGPGGGSAEKPVGTVCISVTYRDTSCTDTRHFGGSRAQIIDRASTTAIMMALNLIRQYHS